MNTETYLWAPKAVVSQLPDQLLEPDGGVLLGLACSVARKVGPKRSKRSNDTPGHLGLDGTS